MDAARSLGMSYRLAMRSVVLPQAVVPLVRIRGRRKSFANHVVLGGIDFEVEPSQVVVVIGPSGSCKSTLLLCCDGLELPESGSVKICGRMLINNGQPLPEAELDLLRRDVGMIFQSFNADRLIEFLGALGHRCSVEKER